jgi:mono/diheme cytochrome c family protein
MFVRIILATLALALAASPAHAADAKDIAEGKRLAHINCAVCHALGAVGPSPLLAAPPFRELHQNYDEGELEDSFNDGIATSHPAMPDWQMSPDQARELAAFIMSFAGAP